MPVLSLCADVEPGVLLVNPARPCLKINDVPVGWEHFSQHGWDVFEVPPPVTINGRLSAVIFVIIFLSTSFFSFSSLLPAPRRLFFRRCWFTAK